MSKDLHLMVTSLCDRACKYCCNKQYDLNDVPYATEEELRSVENVFITGGEPFTYSRPSKIAMRLKREYGNIKKVIVYANAIELEEYMGGRGTARETFLDIDGVTVSIKNHLDLLAFNAIKNDRDLNALKSNRLYLFPPFDVFGKELLPYPDNWEVMAREWQEEFKAAPNSFFRRI